MTAAIELHGVHKTYGDTHALRGIDLEVPAGRIFGFLGPNGAGKTTTARILVDLIRADEGTAAVLGLDCVRDSIEVRRRTGYLPGELRLYESMRGAEFLDYVDSFRPEKRDAKYRAELVERLGLDPTRPIRALSKGNRQKVGLVQALMHRPDLMVLDEPTSGLDPLVQEEVVRILEDAAAEGRTVFFSSHVLSEVEKFPDRRHRPRRRNRRRRRRRQPQGRNVHVVEVTFASPPPMRLFDIPGVSVLRHDGATVRLQSQDAIDALMKAVATQTVIDLRTEQPSLEDVFLEYYTGNGATPPPLVEEQEVRRASA